MRFLIGRRLRTKDQERRTASDSPAMSLCSSRTRAIASSAVSRQSGILKSPWVGERRPRVQHARPGPLKQSLPHLAHEDQRHVLDVPHLQQLPDHQHLEHGADATRHDDEGVGGEHEMMESREEGLVSKACLDEGSHAARTAARRGFQGSLSRRRSSRPRWPPASGQGRHRSRCRSPSTRTPPRPVSLPRRRTSPAARGPSRRSRRDSGRASMASAASGCSRPSRGRRQRSWRISRTASSSARLTMQDRPVASNRLTLQSPPAWVAASMPTTTCRDAGSD